MARSKSRFIMSIGEKRNGIGDGAAYKINNNIRSPKFHYIMTNIIHNDLYNPWRSL